MAEIDLVPGNYRRGLRLLRALRRFAAVYAVLVLSIVATRAALAYGVSQRSAELESLEAALEQERSQRQRLDELRGQKIAAEKRLALLEGLRGGVAAVDMFRVIDRAAASDVWFQDWRFRRAGEVVENDPERVRRGYFIVLPLEERSDREKAWLLHTHMEIRGQALDHTTLAGFVRGLVQQPEVEEARVLSTQTSRRRSAELVDFELAVVVRTRG